MKKHSVPRLVLATLTLLTVFALTPAWAEEGETASVQAIPDAEPSAVSADEESVQEASTIDEDTTATAAAGDFVLFTENTWLIQTGDDSASLPGGSQSHFNCSQFNKSGCAPYSLSGCCCVSSPLIPGYHCGSVCF